MYININTKCRVSGGPRLRLCSGVPRGVCVIFLVYAHGTHSHKAAQTQALLTPGCAGVFELNVGVFLHTRCIMPAAVNHTDIKIDTS